MESDPAMIDVQNVSKVYEMPEEAVRVLTGIEFQVESGKTAAVVGPSGSGKTTLLNLLGALDPLGQLGLLDPLGPLGSIGPTWAHWAHLGSLVPLARAHCAHLGPLGSIGPTWVQ